VSTRIRLTRGERRELCAVRITLKYKIGLDDSGSRKILGTYYGVHLLRVYGYGYIFDVRHPIYREKSIDVEEKFLFWHIGDSEK